jgi:SAM-dependent MidA family methyltransferase
MPAILAGAHRGYASSVSGDARRRILEAIDERGPIAFDEFMGLALYGPGGYFEGPAVGPEADFVTSPHVHPWFAYGLARALGELRDALVADGIADPSAPARLVELGAGDGTLARQLLEILAGAGPIDYVAVERSATARAALAETGASVVATIGDLGEIDGASVFANELLDNLPFRVVRRRGGALFEVLVGREGERLVPVEVEASPALAARAPDREGEAAIPAGALSLIDRLAERMRSGYALLIDYSAERGADVHGYRRHRVVADVLERAGSTDITAGVDLGAVEGRAAERGLVVLGRVSQRDALLALGFAGWLERGRDAAAGAADATATRAWASRSRATLLADPKGLGAHRWLLLATPGLPRPPWLTSAIERPSAD